MKPLVSILIPAFNAEAWIADAIKSAIAQSWSRKEIIIVDDGSSDCTLTIARRFESDSIHVVTQTNRGAAAARNTALSRSRGNYIQWLDADDLMAPDKIARQLEYAMSLGVDARAVLSCAWGHFLYRPQAANFVPTPLWCDLTPLEWFLRRMEYSVFMANANWLVSRELTQAVGPWDTRLTLDDDGEYFGRILMASSGTRFVPEAKVFYRRTGPTSLSYLGCSGEKLSSRFLAIELQTRYARSLEDSLRVRTACVKFLQDSLVTSNLGKPHLDERAVQLAATLGGRLIQPKVSWKYAWIQQLFGRPAARQAQLLMQTYKWTLKRSWDNALSCCDTKWRDVWQ
ncbi:glycosyltransferase family 2 protein [Paludibaculum fermentans]|uniref:glycosyltransferase family 2 protein n=1 Tax=Paludibaculum fermentans TaxID=1473598 RepID=UPI003EB80F95